MISILYRVTCAIFGAMLFVPTASGAQDGPGAALTARLAQSGSGAEVEIGLSRRTGFRVFTLEEPLRVIVDLPDFVWRAEPPRAGEGSRLVSGIRFGIAEGGVARMVIDLRGPGRIVQAFTADAAGSVPARFSLLLAPTDSTDFALRAGWPSGLGPSSETAAPLPSGTPVPRPRPKRAVHVIIDPGHGGKDPGAIAGETEEKDLVLDYAMALAEAISARPGFKAILTREDDSFLSLRDRVAFARRAQGDVFISLHADALEVGVASGTSVFTLSDEASDEEAAALSASHDRADIIAGVTLDDEESDVTRVLVDVARRTTDAQSASLAAAMVENLRGAAPVLEGRAQQSAGFRVLKAPDVPSVLVERGFMSSAADQKRLLSEEGRRRIVESLASAVTAWVAKQNDPRFAPARVGQGN
jgi:N-acetylmuramoyl-L-alanine amidase